MADALARNKRVTIEMVVEKTSAIALPGTLTVQHWLEDAHLTILHIGKIKDLLRDVRDAASSTITETRFSRDIGSYLTFLQHEFLSGDRLLATRYLLIGGSDKYLALSVEPSAYVLSLRLEARRQLVSALERLGVSSGEDFMRRSKAVAQHSPDWVPHVTVSRWPEDRPLPKLEAAVELTLLPPSVRGIQVVR